MGVGQGNNAVSQMAMPISADLAVAAVRVALDGTARSKLVGLHGTAGHAYILHSLARKVGTCHIQNCHVIDCYVVPAAVTWHHSIPRASGQWHEFWHTQVHPRTIKFLTRDPKSYPNPYPVREVLHLGV